MIQICIASLDSEHFHFDAIGTDEAGAVEDLKCGLLAHAKQYGLAPDWFAGRYEIQTRFMIAGAAYRDREEI